MAWLEAEFLGNSLRSWAAALLVAAAVFAMLRFARALILRRVRAFAGVSGAHIGVVTLDVLARTSVLFLLFVSFYAAAHMLVLPPRLGWLLRVAGVAVVVIQLALWGNVIISAVISRQTRRLLDEDAAVATTVNAVGVISRLVLWTLLVLLGLQNLGLQITPLLTGLGIGGIAVALAVQNVLGDLFASLSIVVDKPFVIGDFIIVDELLGTVEHIGLKTTRVRSLSGEQLVFSNSDLLNSRIRNFKRMYHRRVIFDFGVTYQTPHAKASRIGAMLREIVAAQPKTRFDRAHFKEYGDFALKYEVVYHVLEPDFNTYMDIQEAINLELMRRFEEEQIEFAYPTQTIYMAAGHDSPPPAGAASATR
jgi:small-conductance mechanosensitive channel